MRNCLFHVRVSDDSIPISIDWINQETNQFVVTFDSMKTIVYDTETGKTVMELINDNPTSDPAYCANRIISHPTQSVLIAGHEDKKIRYFDRNTGQKQMH